MENTGSGNRETTNAKKQILLLSTCVHGQSKPSTKSEIDRRFKLSGPCVPAVDTGTQADPQSLEPAPTSGSQSRYDRMRSFLRPIKRLDLDSWDQPNEPLFSIATHAWSHVSSYSRVIDKMNPADWPDCLKKCAL